MNFNTLLNIIKKYLSYLDSIIYNSENNFKYGSIYRTPMEICYNTNR